MASDYGEGKGVASLVPDSPAVKRQKTPSGYNSTSTSAHNTAYNSDNDDGDDLLADFNYVPDTPTQGILYETQPTQVIDRATGTFFPSNAGHPPTPPSVVQVPASSPLGGRDSIVLPPVFNATPKSVQDAVKPPRNLAMSMAPAGTLYRPPHGIVTKPLPKEIIKIDDGESENRPISTLSSSDDEDTLASANIRPTTFSTSTSTSNSFNSSSTFQNVIANARYQGPSRLGNAQVRKPQPRPERAMPIEDISVVDLDSELRGRVTRLRMVFPRISVLMAKDLIMQHKGSVDDAVLYLSSKDEPAAPTPIITIDDDDEVSRPAKEEPQMKRTLNAPIQSLRDKYSSTQALARPSPVAPKPKKRLVQGRRNPEPASSPLKPQSPVHNKYDDFDDETDSGLGSGAEEEDPELEGRLLKFLNTCKVEDLVELTSIAKDAAEVMLAARPFKSINVARTVENKPLKSGKKSNKAPIGDKIVTTAIEMFQGYEAIDKLVAECGQLGKPLGEEMAKWGFDVFGAQKEGELEMTSLEEDTDTASQRDSGIGSPSSADAGDDDVKIVAVKRVRGIQFLKKPEMMAEDCVLKDYQVVGLNWLALMYRHKLSGILADEMGLGKTCQVIAFITHLVETGNNGPHLVVCPGSTLENWLREFQKFSPQLMVEPYHGPQKDRPEMADNILANRDRINVVVTTYDMAAKKEDNKFMRRFKPDVCVYDEGHMLKNVASQRYQGLIKIPANFRLLLTGTPLQNNLQELAALLAFILPDVFRDLEDDLRLIFKTKATTQDADHAALLSAQRIGRARSMLTPFVLRRKKAQVLKHLPAKTCRVQYSALHKSQKVIYNGHLDQARERARVRVEGGKVPKSDENNPLMQLRKAAIHPLLFRRHFNDEMIEKMVDILRKKEPINFPSNAKRQHLVDEMRNGSDFWLHQWCRDYPCIAKFDIPDLAWMDSGKVDSMIKLVKQYKENGDRVLIFSQFSLVLDILEAVLNSSLIAFTRIDGSTKIEERQSLIDTFRDDDSITAFLLTTKAGGTGINLMYANKVIIFDGSFNPQDDRQAENRAHRVGQTREVEVVRLVTKGTVEEQIFALGQSKLTLDGRVAGDEDSGKADEAGEKAVSRMLLEGTSISTDDDATTPAPEEEEPKPEEVEAKVPAKSPEKKLPQRRKKASLIDRVATQSSRPKRKAAHMSKVDDDAE